MLQLDYHHIKNATIIECFLLLMWTIYGSIFLNITVTIVVLLAMFLVIMRNLYTWHSAKESVDSLSRSNAFSLGVDTIVKRISRNPEHALLGRGFVWENLHIQRYHDLLKLPERRKYIDLETKGGGYEFMHSLNQQDKEVDIKKDELQHTLIAGTTGSGKTKFFEFLIAQLIPYEPTIIVDPKGDKGLLNGVYDACVDCGVEDRFVYFSLAHPSKSVGFNPISNYGGPSDVADRIASIMPSGSGDQAFQSFAWQVIEVVSSALMGFQEDITLEKLHKYSMDHMNELVEICKEKLPDLSPDIRVYAEKSLERLEKQAGHPKEHHQKMITSLGPVLTSLNTGDITPLLNCPPERSLQWRDVFRHNKIVYFDLSSMLRQEVSNNVGKMIVQDLLYFIGEIYAFENSGKNMNLFVDEFYSVMFSGYIDMLNKSRGAGLRMFLGMQTSADIANALGDGKESYIRQVLGNLNNKIYLRVPEKQLAQEFCDLFGSTYISQIEQTHAESSKSASPFELFGSNYSEKKSQTEAEIVSPDMLMHLPIGQAFAFMQARDPYKLRLTLIDRPEEKKNYFSEKIMKSGTVRFDLANIGGWADFDDSSAEWPRKVRENVQ